jgi:hypothetical protein
MSVKKPICAAHAPTFSCVHFMKTRNPKSTGPRSLAGMDMPWMGLGSDDGAGPTAGAAPTAVGAPSRGFAAEADDFALCHIAASPIDLRLVHLTPYAAS